MRKALDERELENIMTIKTRLLRTLTKEQYERLCYYMLIGIDPLTPEIRNYYLFKQDIPKKLKGGC